MFLVFDDRPSDSPFIERIWTAYSKREDEFLSVAAGHWEMVVTRCRRQAFLTVRGPETKATTMGCPADGEWVGIRFKLGTFLPQLLPGDLRDGRDVTLPGASSRSFWLKGSAWEYPTFENADSFAARLIRKGTIGRDPEVDAMLHGESENLSLRSSQRHFARATGISHAAFRTIERARYATDLLREGVATLDVVHTAGYFDQSHLTRALKHLIGQTPTEIAKRTRQLSFLYKTTPVR
jgi:hypothetical protein